MIDEDKMKDMVEEAEEEINSHDIEMDGYDEDDNNEDYDADEDIVENIME